MCRDLEHGVAACLKVMLLTVEIAVDLGSGLRWEKATSLGFDQYSLACRSTALS